jgi:hypothetical protein
MLKELLNANLPHMRTFLCGMVSELDTSWNKEFSLWVRHWRQPDA